MGRERSTVFLLTTIISDGSNVMHSQPRLPPSCLPKLQREHTKCYKRKHTKAKRKDNSYKVTVANAVNHTYPPLTGRNATNLIKYKIKVFCTVYCEKILKKLTFMVDTLNLFLLFQCARAKNTISA